MIFAIALAFYIVGVLIDDKAVAYGFLALSMLVTVLSAQCFSYRF